VHGTDDVAITIDRARSLAATLSDHRGFLEVPGATHAPNMTHPDEVNVAIREFLQSL